MNLKNFRPSKVTIEDGEGNVLVLSKDAFFANFEYSANELYEFFVHNFDKHILVRRILGLEKGTSLYKKVTQTSAVVNRSSGGIKG